MPTTDHDPDPDDAGLDHARSDHAGLDYATALAELDAILVELEAADVDVDRLADRVERAAVLIAFCRDRIGAARLRIDEVVAGLDTES